MDHDQCDPMKAGFGISVSKYLANALGCWRISVNSTLGKGTRFYIDIPIDDGSLNSEDENVGSLSDESPMDVQRPRLSSNTESVDSINFRNQ